MKMFLISDNVDTYTGMRLAGVDGVVIHSKIHLKEQLEQTFSNKEIGVLLITEKLSQEFPDIINDIKLNHRLPLIVEIPDRHGTGRDPNFIMNYVNEAIGLKL
ncbi:V-type ATP synthase subunit F [Velocimicrobium porci]|uniref:ATP synthase subunit F n=1 Tax=Velocimicrobium porci TaxID=2606634 RepID=A0A6L5XWN3_9FIRM|nr:V-type ATP synthase subunit F [Velocimicrobium porci]MSS62937.1 ATP synthase subunit F [Velocimicrobium porci]